MLTYLDPKRQPPGTMSGGSISFSNMTLDAEGNYLPEANNPTIKWIKVTYPEIWSEFQITGYSEGAIQADHDPETRTIIITSSSEGDGLEQGSNWSLYTQMLFGDVDQTSGDVTFLFSENADGSNPQELTDPITVYVQSPPNGDLQITSDLPFAINTTENVAVSVTNTAVTPIEGILLTLGASKFKSIDLPDGWEVQNPEAAIDSLQIVIRTATDDAVGLLAGETLNFTINVKHTFIPTETYWTTNVAQSRIEQQWQGGGQVLTEYHVIFPGGTIPGGGESPIIPISDEPDAEEIMVQWLNGWTPQLGFPISGDKPKTVTGEFITVDRTGGAREAMVLDRAEILIEVYSKDSRVNAKNMAFKIADRVPNLVSFARDVTGARVNSVVNLDDTQAQFHRYQIYVDMNHRR